MTDTLAAPPPSQDLSPQERVRRLEKLAATGDLPGMLRDIGGLHESWDDLDAPLQAQVLELESIFLTLMNARAGIKG